MASGHQNFSTLSLSLAARLRFDDEPKLMDVKADGGVTTQREQGDDPDILEKPRGATVVLRSSTTDDKT